MRWLAIAGLFSLAGCSTQPETNNNPWVIFVIIFIVLIASGIINPKDKE